METIRTIVVGDVHGCLEELDELLKLLERRDGDRLVFLGDLVDRGPDPVGCVRRVRELGAECILGNHEEKAMRWRRREAEAAGKPNPMKAPRPERRAEWLALSDADLAWMAEMPHVLDIGHGWLAVHGGFEDRPMGKQRRDRVIRCRYLNSSGEMAAINDDLSQPEGTEFWTKRWSGPDSVVYGHNVHDLDEPRIDYDVRDPDAAKVVCVGLDTGCVFGGHLSAMTLFKDRPGVRLITQVKARREYHPRLAA